MPTVTYNWTHVVDDFYVNEVTEGAQSAPSITAINGDTGYFAAWNSTDSLGLFVAGRIRDAYGINSDSEQMLNFASGANGRTQHVTIPGQKTGPPVSISIG